MRETGIRTVLLLARSLRLNAGVGDGGDLEPRFQEAVSCPVLGSILCEMGDASSAH